MFVARTLLMLMVSLGVGAAEITEWIVPWEKTRPRDPDVAPDGRIWFVGQSGHYLAVFDPTDESFHRYELDDGTGPHNLIVAEDGEVWYAGNRAAHIGRMNPETGVIRKIMMPDEKARDPHTLVFDGRGHIWFTLQQSNMVGRLTMENEQVDLVTVPTPKARPYGILVAPDGRPWVVLLGTNKLATVNPESLELTEIVLPRDKTRPRRIARTEDGRIWYVDYSEGFLGAYSPTTRSFQEFAAPSGRKSGPYAMAMDGQDRIWFVETSQTPNRFVGFDPQSETFFSNDPIPSGAGSVRHMVFDSKRNAFWFGTDTNRLGRAAVP